jgi:hypothetical protein
METQNHPIYFLTVPYKSMAASVLLTLFLGPFGLLYSSFFGALIMTILIVPGLFMPMTNVTVPSVITLWLICHFWGALSTSRYNKKLFARCQAFKDESVPCQKS